MAKKTPGVIISHWNTMIKGLEASPKEFFSSVEGAIKKRQVPDTKTSRVDWKEGSMFSAKREYLRVRRKEHVFDICGAPFGNGFFVSWWLGETKSGIMASLAQIPFLGMFLEHLFKPVSYYKIDTSSMFQSLVHSAVLEVVDEMTKAKGVRGPTELERKPHMRNFFQK